MGMLDQGCGLSSQEIGSISLKNEAGDPDLAFETWESTVGLLSFLNT